MINGLIYWNNIHQVEQKSYSSRFRKFSVLIRLLSVITLNPVEYPKNSLNTAVSG